MKSVRNKSTGVSFGTLSLLVLMTSQLTNANNSTLDAKEKDHSSSLAAGEIAGIVIGVLALIILAGMSIKGLRQKCNILDTLKQEPFHYALFKELKLSTRLFKDFKDDGVDSNFYMRFIEEINAILDEIVYTPILNYQDSSSADEEKKTIQTDREEPTTYLEMVQSAEFITTSEGLALVGILAKAIQKEASINHIFLNDRYSGKRNRVSSFFCHAEINIYGLDLKKLNLHRQTIAENVVILSSGSIKKREFSPLFDSDETIEELKYSSRK